MTYRELQSHIKNLTQTANEKLVDISMNGIKSKAITKELDTLSKKGIIGKKGYAVLRFRGKTKEDLITQARELEYFSTWKGTERTAKRTRRDLAKYRAFVVNNSDNANYTYEEWRELVELMGTTSSIREMFDLDSESIKMLTGLEKSEGIYLDLGKEMRVILNQSQGKGLSTEEVTERLRERINVQSALQSINKDSEIQNLYSSYNSQHTSNTDTLEDMLNTIAESYRYKKSSPNIYIKELRERLTK